MREYDEWLIKWLKSEATSYELGDSDCSITDNAGRSAAIDEAVVFLEGRSVAAKAASFKLGVAAVLWRDGKVLMHQRMGSHGAGTWSFPGGHIDEGESPRQTASRETLEEAGLRLAPSEFRPTTYTADVFEVEDKRYITLYLEAQCPVEVGEAIIMEPTKCVEWRWVTPGDWPGELFLPIQNFLKQGYTFSPPVDG